MLAALTSAQAARDPSTAAHCTRVTCLATRLAAWIGWDETRIERLGIGARVHDIGKVMVSERILGKRGPLSPRELAEIRTHPIAGASLIAPVGPARDAIPYVLYHHERWDGDGYPTRRRGTDVPEGARLLAVLDAPVSPCAADASRARRDRALCRNAVRPAYCARVSPGVERGRTRRRGRELTTAPPRPPASTSRGGSPRP